MYMRYMYINSNFKKIQLSVTFVSSPLGIGDDNIYWTWLQCGQYSVFDTFHIHFITIQVSNNYTTYSA